MNRSEYISRPSVSGFVRWLGDRLDTPGSFSHSYQIRKTRTDWQCDCLYSAFRRYEWDFSTHDPASSRPLSGRTFAESADALTKIGRQLREAILCEDHDLALSCCQAVLEWGGIRTGHYLEELGVGLIPTLRRSATALADPGLDLSRLPRIHMNSGWTKVYSLLVDDFAMYDSRVAAALCMLAGLYCQEAGMPSLPRELRFCQVPHRATVDRSPPCFGQQFPMAKYGDDQHLRSNIMGNWILAETVRARPSRFALMQPDGRGLWALQSALFMIGYETLPSAVRPGRAVARASRPTPERAPSVGAASAQERAARLMPLSGRGEPIGVSSLDGMRRIRWGSLQFHLSDALVAEILRDFFRDPAAWYPLGASMTDPPPGGLGAFVRSRGRGLSPRHASAIARIMVDEGLLEWRGAKPIELRKRA